MTSSRSACGARPAARQAPRGQADRTAAAGTSPGTEMVSAALVNVLPAGLVGGDSDSVLCCELFAGVFYDSGSNLNCGSLGKVDTCLLL